MEHSEHTSHTTCETGDTCVLERPRYFPRQLITPAELTLEQDYFREKHRLHNRFLHGWGVVCGARVCPVPTADGSGFEPWKVRVERGYLLDPFGNDILLDRARAFDLRTRCQAIAAGEPCTEPEEDPWCRDVFERPRTEDAPLYVAVRYREFRRRPVRVQPAGCGCDDSQCEHSRWCDGYEICVLPTCPTPHPQSGGQPTPPPADKDHTQQAPGPGNLRILEYTTALTECPPCPESPWVGLARVEVDARGVIQSIDNCACRRIVPSLSPFVGHCASRVMVLTALRVDGLEPTQPLRPGGAYAATITGEGLQQGIQISLGTDVTVSDPQQWTPGVEVEVKVAVSIRATPGPRTLTAVNPDCSMAILPNAITIAAAEAPSGGGEGGTKPAAKPREDRPVRSPRRPR